MRALYVFILLLCAGCSQNNLLTRQDYQKSREAFARGDTDKALLEFPRGREDGDFITTMEKGYLSLLQGKPQIKGLTRQAALLENQVRYHVSREARTFFYVRTPEDYYPSEHEVIWMHLLLGWGYAQQGKYTDTCVEARATSDLLTLPWSPNGHFDDPTLRLFLAGLWTMCGEWREAQVDFRAAWTMDNRLTWAKALADRDKPPAQLFIVLGGPGPEVAWDPEFKANPLRSGRRVAFRLMGHKSALALTDAQGKAIPAYLSPDAGRWYQRHLERESELDEAIQDSAFGGKAAASGVKTTAIITGNLVEGIVEGMVVGAALGIGIVARADTKTPNTGNNNTTGSSTTMTAADYKAAAFVGAILGGVAGGINGAVEGYQSGTTQAKKDLDPSPTYRYVRYLPEYLWVGWSDQPVPYPVSVSTPNASTLLDHPLAAKDISVFIAHLPDADGRNAALFCTYKERGVTIVTEPDADGSCPKYPDL